ncbi:amino acid transporter-like protein [Myriangium duriaei CBS 260.36]|uniref:Amino acid transporter-like protein n=1 Tax=Myriangium duriaei CBS 260.36 TaxID=1168546 RepID=A0A9P4IWI1_9PEZI|nr:amino acid transporter-like protein [Myriangium duriaei CBS 260.36]
MNRLGRPRQKSITGTGGTGGDESDGYAPDYSIQKQLDEESTNSIQYRTCSWKKTAALLFSEYICLAIMSFPYSYSVLGLVPGLILTVIIALIVAYTSLTVWEMCLRHPECKDVCDVAEILFGNKWGRWFTIVIFLLNNTFIQGFHCLTGAKYLNTMTNHSVCTIGFSAIVAVISWLCSTPRTFDGLSKLATLSAFFTFMSVLLATIFSAVEPHPTEYPKYGKLLVSAWPPAGTSFVAGMNAFLNISYTFIGQITIPSFIAEMKEPKDFPKALWAVTIAEILVFSIVGSIIYVYTGSNYMTSPAFGSLGTVKYEKIAFSFMIPTIIFLGVLYASVSSRFIFNSIFNGTRHMSNHTVVGWASWIGILGCTWVCAFIIAEVIPFFSDLLSLMSSLFDSFFGFIFWGWAYLRLRGVAHGPGFWKIRGIRGYVGAVFNVFLIGVGFFFLTVGTYATVVNIVDGYRAANFGGAFSCASNGLTGA